MALLTIVLGLSLLVVWLVCLCPAVYFVHDPCYAVILWITRNLNFMTTCPTHVGKKTVYNIGYNSL